MNITLEDTTSAAIGSALVQVREQSGAMALGRVLTLVISCAGTDTETALEAANQASREHPSRVVLIESGDEQERPQLDAEIRVGGDAGASEVIVLRPHGPAAGAMDTLINPLLLPDAPVVTWWPHQPPAQMSTDPVGQMAQRRISDVGETADPIVELRRLRQTYAPGDTDLSWARTTLWRGLSAGVLEPKPEVRIHGVRVTGDTARPSLHLLGGWFAEALQTPVILEHDPSTTTVTGVHLERAGSSISMHRPEGSPVITITEEGEPDRQVAMPKRPLEDCLMEDLRHLDPDEVYQKALLEGLPKVEIR